MKAKALKKLLNKIPDNVEIKIRVPFRNEGSVELESLDISTVDLSNSVSTSYSGKKSQKETFEVEQEGLITTDEAVRYTSGIPEFGV